MADVVDDAVGEVNGQRLFLLNQVLNALVRGIASGEELAREEKALARIPGGDLRLRE